MAASPAALVIASRRVALLLLVLGLLVVFGAAQARGRRDPAIPQDGLDLHHRVAAGSVIVLGKVEEVKRKAFLRVEEVLRGDPKAIPGLLRVAFFGVNRGRNAGQAPFRVAEGERAVFILARWTDSRGDLRGSDLFRPEGLAKAKIPIPAEGAQALLEAVRALVAYHDSPRRGQVEAELAQWLKGSNNWLVDVALDEAARFSIAGPEWIPGLLLRTRDVNPLRRRLALEAMGTALARGRLGRTGQVSGAQSGEELMAMVREALVRHARTDEDASVRLACVNWLPEAGLRDLEALLKSISRDDPDQNVRYTASTKLLALRR